MNIENSRKYCPECRLYLPIENFKKVTTQSSLRKNPDGRYWCCNPCFMNIEWISTPKTETYNRKMKRRYKLQKRTDYVEYTYGLTKEEYLLKINQQKNLCAICKEKQEGKVLCVDHDHKTGKVRGLLCNQCNIGLGNLKDDTQILQSAIEYLKSCSIEK